MKSALSLSSAARIGGVFLVFVFFVETEMIANIIICLQLLVSLLLFTAQDGCAEGGLSIINNYNCKRSDIDKGLVAAINLIILVQDCKVATEAKVLGSKIVTTILYQSRGLSGNQEQLIFRHPKLKTHRGYSRLQNQRKNRDVHISSVYHSLELLHLFLDHRTVFCRDHMSLDKDIFDLRICREMLLYVLWVEKSQWIISNFI